MSLEIINEMVVGSLFIHNGKNYLVNEIRKIYPEDQKLSVWLVDGEADFTVLDLTYSEFYQKVVK